MVHTLGTLLEDTRYKTALKDGNVTTLVGAFISGIASMGSSGKNPLEEPQKDGGYEVLNRDAGEFFICRIHPKCVYGVVLDVFSNLTIHVSI